MKVNGEIFEMVTPLTLNQLLQQKGYDPEKIAVELNGKIVPRREYASVILTDADILEVVSFVGGG